jgi:hypothetical protein
MEPVSGKYTREQFEDLYDLLLNVAANTEDEVMSHRINILAERLDNVMNADIEEEGEIPEDLSQTPNSQRTYNLIVKIMGWQKDPRVGSGRSGYFHVMPKPIVKCS